MTRHNSAQRFTATDTLALSGGTKACDVEPHECYPVPTQAIKDAVCSLIDKGIYSTTDQEHYQSVEKEWAQYCGSKYCLAQNNGTSTLLAAYWALGVGSGDDIISSAYTWISSYAPVWQLGANVIMAEMDPESFLLDPEKLEEKMSSGGIKSSTCGRIKIDH